MIIAKSSQVTSRKSRQKEYKRKRETVRSEMKESVLQLQIFQEDKSATGSRGLNVLHCTAELMVSSAVHGADAERLGVLPSVLPSSKLSASLSLTDIL